MGLREYRAKRAFGATPEPRGKPRRTGRKLRFVVQKHAATRLHYDFRLELGGVLVSWAIPKGPSLNPDDKRLAMQVEDHPFDYRTFEGVIPDGQYGAGPVMVWDQGWYEPYEDGADSERILRLGIRQGDLKVRLHGRKLRGAWAIVRAKSFGRNSWLMIKKRDDGVSLKDVTLQDHSVKTGKSMAEISEHLERLKIGRKAVRVTNRRKVFWPQDGYTKGDVIDYYRKVAKVILPYLTGRPESLNRFPEGITGKSFYQKDVDHQPPDWIKTKRIRSESGGQAVRWLVCDDEPTLVYLANLGCIELNSWHSRIGSLRKPDYLLLDLDAKTATFDQVVTVARTVRELLDELKIPSVPKTSGQTGMHICIPLEAKYSYDRSRLLAEALMRLVHRRRPHLTSLERQPDKRKGLVYLDFLQNRKGQTMAAPYCVRPVPGAPVSTPLEWKEVRKGLDPKKFTIKTTAARLKRKGDLWKPVLGKGIDLTETLKQID